MNKKNVKKSLIVSYPCCGLDEAGRGALAGPLVAAGVVLSQDTERIILRSCLPVNDSKCMTPKDRLRVYEYLKTINVNFRTVVISARRINNRGISFANIMAFRLLIRELHADQYIVDGNLKIGRMKNKTQKIISVVNADASLLPSMLAGIIAKVERDAIMAALHTSYPLYLWNKNSGYGTARHIEALKLYGRTRYHRNIFITTALKNSYKGLL